MSESGLKPDPSAIGGVTKPPFAKRPDPASLFAARAQRLEFLAAGSELGPYLRFLAELARAQDAVLPHLPPVSAPEPAALARAREFAMPVLDRNALAGDDTAQATLRRLFDAFDSVAKPEPARQALAALRASEPEAIAELVSNVLGDAIPADRVAEHVYVAAGLQLHFARCAAALDEQALTPIETGLCPACGSRPSGSLVVGWYGAEGARYACCSLCATLWNEVRVKCLACGSTKGIGFQEVEGAAATVKAETCDECNSYLKVFYQQRDMAMEALADDVASLGLDLLLREGGRYARAGVNPFLAGY